MNTLTINIDLATTPVDAVAEVLRILNGNPISAPVAAAPKKEGKKEVVKTDDNVSKSEPAPAVSAPPAAEAATDTVTIEQVRAAVAEKRTTHRQEIKDILTKHGSESVTTLAPEKYAAVLTEIKAL